MDRGPLFERNIPSVESDHPSVDCLRIESHGYHLGTDLETKLAVLTFVDMMSLRPYCVSVELTTQQLFGAVASIYQVWAAAVGFLSRFDQLVLQFLEGSMQ